MINIEYAVKIFLKRQTLDEALFLNHLYEGGGFDSARHSNFTSWPESPDISSGFLMNAGSSREDIITNYCLWTNMLKNKISFTI